MRKIVSLLLSFGMIFALAACSQSAASEKQEQIQSAVQKTEEQEADVSTKTLVVFFMYGNNKAIGRICCGNSGSGSL